MFSMPRATSPAASERTLPCSAVMSPAISSRWAWKALRMANMMSARFDSEVARHFGKAALAAATVISSSSGLATSTVLV